MNASNQQLLKLVIEEIVQCLNRKWISVPVLQFCLFQIIWNLGEINSVSYRNRSSSRFNLNLKEIFKHFLILEISPILEQGQMKNKQQQYVELLAFLPFQTQCRDVLPLAFLYIYNWKMKIFMRNRNTGNKRSREVSWLIVWQFVWSRSVLWQFVWSRSVLCYVPQHFLMGLRHDWAQHFLINDMFLFYVSRTVNWVFFNETLTAHSPHLGHFFLLNTVK